MNEPKTENKPEKKGFTFTDPGCRTDVRVGTLLLLLGVFLWQFMGPSKMMPIALIGVALLSYSIPLQALQKIKNDMPGFPHKLGIAMSIIGLYMLPDYVYKTSVNSNLEFISWNLLLLCSGLWVLLWWGIIFIKKQKKATDD